MFVMVTLCGGGSKVIHIINGNLNFEAELNLFYPLSPLWDIESY